MKVYEIKVSQDSSPIDAPVSQPVTIKHGDRYVKVVAEEVQGIAASVCGSCCFRDRTIDTAMEYVTCGCLLCAREYRKDKKDVRFKLLERNF